MNALDVGLSAARGTGERERAPQASVAVVTDRERPVGAPG